MAASIRTCNCPNKFQDKQYGKHRRVWNATNDGWRCTVCSKEDKTGK